MSPDTFFVVALVIKMLISGFFIVGATIAAERGGPLMGGLITTLPVAAGPGYIFLALDHSREFVASTALSGFVINVATGIYALTYIVLAKKIGSRLSLVLGLSLWLGLGYVLPLAPWTLAGAALLNAVVFAVCVVVSRPYCAAHVPQIRVRWTDIAIRAGMVAAMVASVVTLSAQIGPSGSAVLAGFPVTYTSMMLILGPRIGVAATAAVLAHGFLGLAGFGVALMMLQTTIVPLGAPVAFTLALSVSLLWNLSLYAIQRRQRAVA